jgi:hypothetical protein
MFSPPSVHGGLPDCADDFCGWFGAGRSAAAGAADEENLTRIQDMIAGRLEKFGRRENLNVTWHPAQAEIP